MVEEIIPESKGNPSIMVHNEYFMIMVLLMATFGFKTKDNNMILIILE